MTADRIDRRTLLGRAATVAASSSLLTTGTVSGAATPAARPRTVPLPSPHQVREDFTRMVEFGPRLTASPEPRPLHLAGSRTSSSGAGYGWRTATATRPIGGWPRTSGSTIGTGPAAGPVKIATYYPRSQQTPPAGRHRPARVRRRGPTLSPAGPTWPPLARRRSSAIPPSSRSWAQGSGALRPGRHRGDDPAGRPADAGPPHRGGIPADRHRT